MIGLSDVRSGEKAVDLGSGDGRIVIALAAREAEAHGYEIDRERVILSRINIRNAGLVGLATIHHQDFWNADVTEFDIITVYGITSIMGRLERKLRAETKSGCRIICNTFPLPSWLLDKKVGQIFRYRQI